MASGGPEIEQLIQLLARLPGLGPRSARRAVLQLVKKKEQLMIPLSAALERAVVAVRTCEVCGNIDTMSPCFICSDPRRDSGMLIVVEDVADLWALERAGLGRSGITCRTGCCRRSMGLDQTILRSMRC